ncbi:hypothetical protein J4439_07940 [Candidatus Woesearchaeota archaeon]|nr:hypothetical protein [Candidatus Woesearchaeota archaeon]
MELERIRPLLDECANPLFLFDDDTDGVCSYLQLQRYCKKGHGSVVKAAPTLPESYLRKVEEHHPDLVVVLDKPGLSDEFVQGCKVPLLWIDHHPPQHRHPKVKYFNPLLLDEKDNRPTSYWAWRIAEQDLWLAMTGIVGDWQLTELAAVFSERRPDLLPPSVSRPQDALFSTPIGNFARLVSFVLKGRVSEVMKCIRIIGQLDSPDEVLSQSTPRGRYLHKRYVQVRQEYDRLVAEAEGMLSSEKLLVYTYTEESTSFTGDLSNELIYRHPDKVILVCRSKSGEMKCSLRSTDVDLQRAVAKALLGVQGYGGGHEHACGACVKDEDWQRFLEALRAQLG